MEITKVVELKRGQYGYGLKFENISGKYNKSAKIIRIQPGSLEEEVGLKVGDQITSINDTTVHGLSQMELMNIIRGSFGDTLKLTVFDSIHEDDALVSRDQRSIENLRLREYGSPRNSRRQSMTTSCHSPLPRNYLNVPRRRYSDCIPTDEVIREGYIKTSTPATKSSGLSSQHSCQHSHSSITGEEDCCPPSASTKSSRSMSPTSPSYFNAFSSNNVSQFDETETNDTRSQSQSKLDNLSQSSINMLEQSENSYEDLPRVVKKAAYSSNVTPTKKTRAEPRVSDVSSRRKGNYTNIESQPKISYKPRRSNEPPMNKVSYTPKVCFHNSLDAPISSRIIPPKPYSEVVPLSKDLDNLSFLTSSEFSIRSTDSLHNAKSQSKSSLEATSKESVKEQSAEINPSGSKKHKLPNLTKFKYWGRDKRDPSDYNDNDSNKSLSNFSLPLHEHVPSLSDEFVPFEMELCVRIVEMFGLYMEGIYRRNPNFSVLKELTSYLDKDLPDIDGESEKWNDIHGICGLLKSFLRQLPELILPDDLRENLLKSSREIEDMTECVRRIKFHLDCLRDSRTMTQKPQCHFHYHSLHYLVRHLVQVAKYNTKNMMNAYNLAVVFFPNLLSTTDLTTDDRDARIRIVQVMIEYSEWMFSNTDSESTPTQDDWVTGNIPIPTEEEQPKPDYEEPRLLVQDTLQTLMDKRSPSFNQKSDHKKPESIWKYKGKDKDKRKASASEGTKTYQSNSLATPMGDKPYSSSSSSDLTAHTSDYQSTRILRISLPKPSSTPTLRKSLKSYNKSSESQLSLMSCASSSSTDRLAKRWGLLLPDDGDTLVRKSAEAMQAIARNITQSVSLISSERKSTATTADNLPAVPESESQELLACYSSDHSSESSGDISPITPKKTIFLNRGSSKRSSLPQNAMPITPRLRTIGDSDTAELPSTFHLQRPSLAPAKSIEVLYPSPEDQAIEKPPLLEVEKSDGELSKPTALLETPL